MGSIRAKKQTFSRRVLLITSVFQASPTPSVGLGGFWGGLVEGPTSSRRVSLDASFHTPYVACRRYNACGRAWAHATVLLAPHPGTLYYYISQTGCEDPGCKYNISLITFGTLAGPWQDPGGTLDATNHIHPCYSWDPGWTLVGPWLDPGYEILNSPTHRVRVC